MFRVSAESAGNSKRCRFAVPAIVLVFFVFAGVIPFPSYAAFGGGEPTVFNPNVFTAQSSQVRVDGPTGALTYQIPIVIPSGRNGLHPDLTLEYSSQNTEDGIVGYGWNISIPYIQRINKTGIENLYATNATFLSSIDGELVEVSPTGVTHRARVDSGSYNAYSLVNNTWTMYDKSGTRYLFGSSDVGRQYDTATTSVKTHKWMLQEIRDTNDNHVAFTYSKDGNQLYPSQITYTGNGSTDGPFVVSFTTAVRPDVRVGYKTGFKVTMQYRISQITASINGNVSGKYLLSYGSGNNGTRSLLTGVERQGHAEDGTLTALPAITFSYSNSSQKFYTPSASGGIGLTSSAYIPSDINGNGILDVNYFFDINDGTGAHGQLFVDQATSVYPVTIPDYWANTNGAEDRGVRYLDVNGDGKADVVRGFQDDQAVTTTSTIHLNTYAGNYGWTASTTFNGVVPPFGYKTVNGVYVMTSGLFGEVNGDELPDYIMSLPSYTGSATYFGNGSAWTSTTTAFGAVYSMPTTAPTGIASQLIDINGDGLDDWLYSDTAGTYVKLNNGTGWDGAASSQWSIATSTLYYSQYGGNGPIAYYDRGIRFMDINGDGFPDFVRAYFTPQHNACVNVPPAEVADVKIIFLNTGNGWATSTAYSLGNSYIASGAISGGGGCNFNGVINHSEYANWIGNGQMVQDVITKITYSEGGSKNVIYTPSAQLGTNPELPVSLLVVKETAENDGFGNVASTTYAYGGGKLHLASGIKDRKFAGFAVATTTAPDSITTTYYHQGDNVDTALGEQNDSYARINRPFREDIFDLSSNLKQRTYYRWDTNDVNGSILTTRGNEMVFRYGSGGAHKDNATEYTYDTTTRDVTQVVEYGEVSGSTNGTFSDLRTDKRTTNYTYATSSTVNMSLPKSQTLLNYSSATTTDERYYYDGLSLGSITKGNRTKIEKWKSDTTYVNEQKTYNSFGLPISSTDPRGKQTTYTYDAYNLYIATSTNPLSQNTQYYYDYSLGKPKQTIDVNGRVFETVYDGIDRPITEKQPDIASPGTLITKKTYAYTDTVGSRKIVETNHLDSSTSFVLYNYFDGLDRVVQTRKEAEGNGDYSVKDFAYNAVGLLKNESLPYFSNGTSRTSASTNGNLYTNYTYDVLKRPATVANAVGTTTTTYDQWTTTVTDPLNNIKDYVRDAFGRLTQVVEHDETNQYITEYAYGATDNLTKITDADSNIRNFTYDGLNRRLTAQDLHDVADGTFGTWTYTYDDSGNLTSKVDPKSQTVNLTYDDINRTLTEDYTGQTGTEVAYTYDTCAEGVGRLCTATSTGVTTQPAYNALGLTASEAKTINGTNYSTSYAYNRQGNPTGVVYPDNSEIQYTYNTAGLLETIAQKESGGSFLNLVSDFDYAPTEKVTFKAFANGVQTTYTYDANALYRLTNILTTTPSGGGGGGAFLNGFWSTLARATEELPLALKHTLALGDIINTEVSSSAGDSSLDVDTTSDVSSVNGAETAVVEASASSTETVREDFVSVDNATSTETILSEPVSETTLDASPPTTTIPKATTTPETMVGTESVSETKPETTTSGTASTTPTTTDSAPLLQGESATSTGATIELPLVTATSSEPTPVDIEPQATTTGAVSQKEVISKNIRALIAGKNANERATIKGKELAKIRALPRTDRPQFNIEIVSTEAVEGGVQVFARAWSKEGEQIGFGEDGSVDIERFRIFNPPILVPDPNGDIVQEWEEKDPATDALVKHVRILREDPQEALLQTIEHTLSVMKHIHLSSEIIPGKRGNTTSTFFSATGDNSPLDGMTHKNGTSGVSWNSVRNASLSSSIETDSTRIYLGFIAANQEGNTYSISRTFTLFDTTSIPDTDIISSASVLVYPSTRSTSQPLPSESDHSVVVLQSNPDSTSSLSTNDYDNVGSLNSPTEGSGRMHINNDFILNAYNTISLNANGISWIDKTGITKLGFRHIADVDNKQPTQQNGAYSAIRVYAADQLGTTQDPKLVIEHTFPNDTPTAPTSLLTEGRTNPTNLSDPTPEFSAIFNDVNGADTANHYQMQVATSSSFSSMYWDSTKTALSSSTPPSVRTPDISYSGSTLASSTTYYWRIKLWDSVGAESPWSTATSTFSLEAAYVPPPAQTGGLQNISFTYDAAGNITQITDSATTSGLYRNITYTYDDLYRLTSASTTAASSTPFSHVYTYNKLGNILSMTGLGTYIYPETAYMNPHAVGTIGNGTATTTYTYDNNGNLTGAGNDSYTWDYRNRLTGSNVSSAATAYGYDHTTQRVFKITNNATTTYPTKYYNLTTATTTKHVFTPDGELIATIIGSGATTTKHYIHTDHLGGTNVVTDENSGVVQTLDYYPFGSERINETYGAPPSQKTFVGLDSDTSTGLLYAKARYMDPSRGQFISQDPVFWELGQTSEGRAALVDPQLQNSYSWARNNPIILKDPDGRFVPQAVALGFLYGGIANVAFQGYAGNINSFGDFANAFATGGAVTAATLVNPFFGGGAAASLSLADSAGRNGGNLTWENGINAGAQGAVTWATGGFLKGLPGVPGPQASKVFGGYYFGGAHGVRYAQEAAFGFGTDVYHHNIQQITQSLLNFYAPQTTNSGSSGGGGNINQLSQSVINYAGTSGANLSDPGFVAGVRAINEYNSSLK